MQQIMTMGFFTALLAATLRMATPLLLTGIGELAGEQGGITNIGLEGLMTMGAITAVLADYATGSAWVGLLAAMAAGVAVNLVFAWAVLYQGSHPIVMGMVINILSFSLATLLNRLAFGIRLMPVSVQSLAPVPIPALSKLPFLGEAVFSQNILVYLAFLLVPAAWFALFKTQPGLTLRAVGERPEAALSMGIDVRRYRMAGCGVCGAMAGLGGAFLAIGYMSRYTENLVSGRGYIALAAVIFGGMRPGGLLAAAVLFGFADALQMRIQSAGVGANTQIMVILPYLVTLVALVALGRRKGAYGVRQ